MLHPRSAARPDPGAPDPHRCASERRRSTYWPLPVHVTDKPTPTIVLRLIERLVARAGKHALDHGPRQPRPVELEPERRRRTPIRRLRSTPACVVRSQGPPDPSHVNDDADAVCVGHVEGRSSTAGIVPYYMFVERDTGARRYFEVPLARAQEIYAEAIRSVSGLARTARGPSMSAAPGRSRSRADGRSTASASSSCASSRARDPDWVSRPFFARFDPEALARRPRARFRRREVLLGRGLRRLLPPPPLPGDAGGLGTDRVLQTVGERGVAGRVKALVATPGLRVHERARDLEGG